MSDSIVFEKSKRFAIRIVKLYKYLCDEKKEVVLSKQLLRSGTSIGANIAEANSAFSKKDFLAKMYIAFKECSERGIVFECNPNKENCSEPYSVSNGKILLNY